jgi:hypothetical protein
MVTNTSLGMSLVTSCSHQIKITLISEEGFHGSRGTRAVRKNILLMCGLGLGRPTRSLLVSRNLLENFIKKFSIYLAHIILYASRA